MATLNRRGHSMDHHTLSYHHPVTTTKPNFPFRQPTFLAHHYHHSTSFIPFAYLFQTLEHNPGPPLQALLSLFTLPLSTAHTIITMISPSIAHFHYSITHCQVPITLLHRIQPELQIGAGVSSHFVICVRFAFPIFTSSQWEFSLLWPFLLHLFLPF
jgi:hypothetical protein